MKAFTIGLRVLAPGFDWLSAGITRGEVGFAEDCAGHMKTGGRPRGRGAGAFRESSTISQVIAMLKHDGGMTLEGSPPGVEYEQLENGSTSSQRELI